MNKNILIIFFQIIDGLRKLPEQIRIVLAKDLSVQQLAKELVNEVHRLLKAVTFSPSFFFT